MILTNNLNVKADYLSVYPFDLQKTLTYAHKKVYNLNYPAQVYSLVGNYQKANFPLPKFIPT